VSSPVCSLEAGLCAHLALEYQVQEPLKGQYRSGRAAIASGSALGDRAVGP